MEQGSFTSFREGFPGVLVGIRVAGEVLGEILQGSIIETLVQDVRVFRLHFFLFQN